jgi:hypothetical protein
MRLVAEADGHRFWTAETFSPERCALRPNVLEMIGWKRQSLSVLSICGGGGGTKSRALCTYRVPAKLHTLQWPQYSPSLVPSPNRSDCSIIAMRDDGRLVKDHQFPRCAVSLAFWHLLFFRQTSHDSYYFLEDGRELLGSPEHSHTRARRVLDQPRPSVRRYQIFAFPSKFRSCISAAINTH